MSVQYATEAELASYMQQDVDTSTATLALQAASATFAQYADTAFSPISTTWTFPGNGGREIWIPFRPVVTVSAIRVNSVAITDYTLINRRLYRSVGFGTFNTFPPDVIEVDLDYGFTTVPDDVKGAVLETAASAFASPDTATVSEQIDDYKLIGSRDGGGMQLSPAASKLARWYRGNLLR